MDQVSLPIRLALVAVLAFAALWFVALRPKPVETAATPAPTAAPATPAADASGAPGVDGLASAVDKAKGAVDTANTASAKVEAATGGTGSATPAAVAKTPASAAVKPATPAKAAKPADLSVPLLRSLEAGKTVVLLFSGKGADDRAAKRAVKAVPRRGGDVVVKVASIDRVASFGAITRGVQVTTAPTTLVIGPDGKARQILGFTDADEVAQAVGDTLRR
ncbi:hypothetical protein [Conexibacter sp. SYSU D00693]|uniref:hypothetical protein n=1 Tax=Conexibacter sp. SYSU D00693 TaxID=2812560 RepID=UPI00196A3496|nr:hypothetical protein [Conexibacter sp. SYSU D00693]